MDPWRPQDYEPGPQQPQLPPPRTGKSGLRNNNKASLKLGPSGDFVMAVHQHHQQEQKQEKPQQEYDDRFSLASSSQVPPLLPLVANIGGSLALFVILLIVYKRTFYPHHGHPYHPTSNPAGSTTTQP